MATQCSPDCPGVKCGCSSGSIAEGFEQRFNGPHSHPKSREQASASKGAGIHYDGDGIGQTILTCIRIRLGLIVGPLHHHGASEGSGQATPSSRRNGALPRPCPFHTAEQPGVPALCTVAPSQIEIVHAVARSLASDVSDGSE